MCHLAKSAWLVLAVLACTAAADAETPTEEQAKRHWLRLQQSHAELFEPLGDDRFRMVTPLFEYSGIVQVTAIELDDQSRRLGESYTLATVSTRLEPEPDLSSAADATGYQRWSALNLLYFDDETGRWYSGEAWQQRVSDRPAAAGGGAGGGVVKDSAVVLAAAIIVIAVLIAFGRRKGDAAPATPRAEALQERMVELLRETNLVLREIRQDLGRLAQQRGMRLDDEDRSGSENDGIDDSPVPLADKDGLA